MLSLHTPPPPNCTLPFIPFSSDSFTSLALFHPPLLPQHSLLRCISPSPPPSLCLLTPAAHYIPPLRHTLPSSLHPSLPPFPSALPASSLHRSTPPLTHCGCAVCRHFPHHHRSLRLTQLVEVRSCSSLTGTPTDKSTALLYD